MSKQQQESVKHNAEPYIVWGFVALLLTCITGYLLLMVYAFASMVHPSLEGWDRFKAIAEKVFPEIYIFAGLFVLSFSLALLCIVHGISGWRWSRPTWLKIFMPLIIVVSILSVIWYVVSR